MPLFEYECRACGQHFEYLTRDGQSPSCPACAGVDLQKLLSVFDQTAHVPGGKDPIRTRPGPLSVASEPPT